MRRFSWSRHLRQPFLLWWLLLPLGLQTVGTAVLIGVLLHGNAAQPAVESANPLPAANGYLTPAIALWGAVQVLAVGLGAAIARTVAAPKRPQGGLPNASASHDCRMIEAALQASEARFQTLMAHIPGMVYRYLPGSDGDGAFTYVSAGCYELFGLSPNQVLQNANAVWGLIHPDDWPSLQASVASAVARCADWHWEGRFTTVTGQPRWLQGRARPQPTPAGAVWDGLLIDITALKQTETALNQEISYRRALLNASIDGVVIVDREGNVLEANHSFTAMLGYTPAEILSLNVADFDVDLGHLKEDLKSEKTKLCLDRFERLHRRKDGSTYAVEISANAVDWNGQAVHLCVCRDISDRVRAEAIRRESEARYLSILEEQTEFITRFQPDGKLIFVNNAYCRYFSQSKAQLEGQNYQPVVYPADQPAIDRCLASLSPETPIRTVENRVYVRGELRWTTWTNKAIYDDCGNLIELQSVGQDIHDRKRAELALAESEARFQRLTAASPAIIYTVIESLQGIVRFEYLSPAAEEIHEIPIATLMQNGALISEQMHPDDRERYLEAYAASLQSMTTFICEWRIITPSGKTKWLKANSRPEQRPSGEVAWHGITLDITPRKQAEAALGNLQAALLEAQQVAHIGNWEFDLASQKITWSPELFRMFGLDPAQGEPTYADYLELLQPDDRILLQQAVDRAIAEGTPYRLDYRVLLPDGSLRYQEGRGKVERDRTGQVVRLFGTALDITDRKHTEIALQASQLRLQLAINSTGTGTWDWNMQTNEVLFDQKLWRALLGYGADAAIDNSVAEWESRIHPKDKPQVQADIARHIRGETEIYENTHRLRCHDGTYKWNLAQGKIIERDDRGNPIRFVGIHRDVSEQVLLDAGRRLAEEALQASEARFRAIFEQAAVGINQADASGRFIQANQYFCGLLGYTQAELLRLTVQDLTHPEDLERDRLQILRLFQGKQKGFTTIKRYRHRHGSWIWTEVTLSAICNPAGEVISDLAIVVDIRKLRQANAALKASEARLRAIFDQALAGINQIDSQGQFTEANQYFCDLLGYSRDELLALKLEDLIHPDDMERCREPVDRILRGEIDNLRLERRQRHKNGDWIWTEAMISLLRDEAGEVIGNLAVVVDIRERIRLEADRKRAEQTIRQQAERETMLRKLTQSIHRSLDLQTIFDTACREIRACLQADRVGIFKFRPGSSYSTGELVAEAMVDGVTPVLAIPIHDHCFGERRAAFYAEGHCHIIDDIYASDLENCYIDFLAQLQVRANLVIPLLCGRDLWGLLCIHQCAGPRHWLRADIDLGCQLAHQLALAIKQALFVEQIQSELQVRQRAEAKIAHQLRQQTALGMILQQVRESLDLDQILATVTQNVQEILQSDRVIIFQVHSDGHSKIVEEAVSESLPTLKGMRWEDEVWSQDILDVYWRGQPRIVADVMADTWTDCLVDYSQAGQIQSKIVAPILQEIRTSEGHRWVAPRAKNKIWGVLVVHACRQKRVWQDSEAQLLQQIANQLAIAIQQSTLFEQLQQELSDRQLAQQQLTESNQELAVANQALSRATRLKDEFLANMSHELRTPLNVILGFAQILSSDLSLQAQQQEYIRIMHRSGDHLLHLINDILDLSKIEANRITLEPESIDLLELLHDLQGMFQERAEDKELRFTLALAPDLPQYIVADPNKLRQVLINLLGNAIKFTQEGSVALRVSLALPEHPEPQPEPPQPYLSFAVEDTGTGIAPAELASIFDAFTQAKAGKVSLEGTGLGLAISRSLVQLMGGSLTVSSRLGQGSTFCFSLPCHRGRAEDVALTNYPGAVTGLAPAQPNYRILVVDDQPENRQLLLAAFSQVGLAVREAAHGAEAIAQWRQWQPHLIWMDLRMPTLDGCEATRRIRAESAAIANGDRPIIIALSAQASNDECSNALAAGCDDFVSKPVKLNLLWTKMSDYLGLRYVYAETPTPAGLVNPTSAKAIRIDTSDLQVMPPEWIGALHQAALHCDSHDTAQLIQQIPAEHGALTTSLNRLLDGYKFEVIMQLTQPYLEAAP
ncbi:PAS domain S-box protein [Nodosilinea nodulosa]|uniref:PAS domain S-box protein n=1 Tax=Nodosilinea nodulosa TaxID=416001 RepID=UPI00037BEFCB|nr:PAS domain S-box protein [Nodosilinea nodulosa]